jgi:hypothetical protein
MVHVVAISQAGELSAIDASSIATTSSQSILHGVCIKDVSIGLLDTSFYVTIPQTITKYVAVSNTSGSITIDLRVAPFGIIPTASHSVTPITKPSIVNNWCNKGELAPLAPIALGLDDVVYFYVEFFAAITSVTFTFL